VELGLKKQEKRRSGFGFKIAGPNPNFNCGRKMIFQQLVLNTLDNSLQRLQTDYIDLYNYIGQNAKPIILGKEDLKYKTMPGKITFMLFWTL
jgi:aryl-alcohol dehydrogenase-like predicted oxidoreductase